MGGPIDDYGFGAAWVFTRSGGVWTQQGEKLVGKATRVSDQGFSVALSTDGNTAILGGPQHGDFFDSYLPGAAWVFKRSAGSWKQQGAPLANKSTTGAWFGWSVAIDGDGNTAIVAGDVYGWGPGGAWIFERNGAAWTQQGAKLFGSGPVGNAHQSAVAISADGNTAIVGGPSDNLGVGAAWVFVRQAATQAAAIPTLGGGWLLVLSAALGTIALVALRSRFSA